MEKIMHFKKNTVYTGRGGGGSSFVTPIWWWGRGEDGIERWGGLVMLKPAPAPPCCHA